MKTIISSLFVLPSAVFFWFFLYCRWFCLRKSFSDTNGMFTLTNYTDIITNPYYFRALRNSMLLSLAVTVAALIIGAILAFTFSRNDFRGKSFLISVLSFPVSLPGVVVGFMIIILFGNTGIIPNFTKCLPVKMFSIAYTQTGIFLAYLYFIGPRTAITLYGALVDFDEN